ncbi:MULTISPECIES: thiol-disulfide oxidoreductase ResA [unclassified Cytobacillus]|uniref:thiol-disulfide oxidoreductase ResA n=1 Tax=unclassified Cytobacillus TaxID=2675268 RepID=UPI00135CD803|nr:thiol-disulfide oxidoreductase ResA [Cytobacillus sp. AMY 15.2]KAF0816963.1 Cytochrome c-type biogenesis protein ResA [Bacillus sp. ZZV12-4809]MCM3093086.1 thiol-disulfide oxidoreductase ResA [Cytobacillus sp. AMY 15.2]
MKKQRLVMRTVILLVLGAAVAYTLYANFTKDKVQKVAVGESAPDFVLTDMDGNKHRLSDYEGQGVFLNFWGTWCKPCEKEMPYMNNQYKQFKDEGVQVLAVNVGETDLAVNKFSERYDLSFPIVIDKNSQVQSAYGINPLPATFLIDKEGKVVKYITGEMTEEMIKNYMEQIKP